jgi:hypothetical protein
VKVAAVVLALSALPAVAQERAAVPTEVIFDLWRITCLNYSDSPAGLYQALNALPELEEVREGWFAAANIAFDVGVIPQPPGSTGCAVAFLPRAGFEAVDEFLQGFVYNLDPSAFRNREGIWRFSLMRKQFTLFPAYDEDSGVMFMTLITDY